MPRFDVLVRLNPLEARQYAPDPLPYKLTVAVAHQVGSLCSHDLVGGTFVAVCMVLALIGGILASIGGSASREIPFGTSPIR
jgi:hypothetical protein